MLRKPQPTLRSRLRGVLLGTSVMFGLELSTAQYDVCERFGGDKR